MFFKIIISLLFLSSAVAASTNKNFTDLSLEERIALNRNDVINAVSKFGVGEKIAFWADFFVGTPYDPIPIGSYVQNLSINEEDVFDCMSLTFRVLELAFAKNESSALDNALYFRFKEMGIPNPKNKAKVLTYEGRYEYGEDMIFSKKYGKLVNEEIGEPKKIEAGSHMGGLVSVLSFKEVEENLNGLRSGDIIFFVKNPRNRTVGETIGHIGFIKREKGKVYLIHAAGAKNKTDGKVTKLLLTDYMESRKNTFLGVMVTRF